MKSSEEQLILLKLKKDSGLGHPDSKYATPAMYNWVKSLAMIIDSSDDFSHENLVKLYSGKPRLKEDEDAKFIALTYDNVMMALNYHSSLKAMLNHSNHSDFLINGIISWYYSIYNSAKAMLTANMQPLEDPNHSTVAQRWYCDFVLTHKIPAPFNIGVSSLSKNEEKALDYKEDAREINYNLYKNPNNINEAEIAVKMYLSGVIKNEREKVEKRVKKDYKIEDFRKKINSIKRDEAFVKSRHIGFLNMAFRYRGKANYRDALFLTYNIDALPRQKELIKNMVKTSDAFLKLTSYYLYYRLPKDYWHMLLNDLKTHSTLSENGETLYYQQKRK
tara:strand:- start:2261 stop:3259 length:999 start_codon:yes stop_codon:yes gene_type:complete